MFISFQKKKKKIPDDTILKGKINDIEIKSCVFYTPTKPEDPLPQIQLKNNLINLIYQSQKLYRNHQTNITKEQITILLEILSQITISNDITITEDQQGILQTYKA